MEIAMLGDIALIGKYDTEKSSDWKEKLRNIKEYLSGFDYVIANLESPLTSRTKTIIPKSVHLRSNISNIAVLKYLGINAVTLANNHVFDFGIKGLKQTIAVLEENQIEWYGAFGKDLLIKDRETKINLSGFCCLTTAGAGIKKTGGVNLLCPDSIRRQIEKDKAMNAYSIFSIHWGHENCSLPSPDHVMMANKIFRQKEDVIIHGHHSHCIEGIEQHANGVAAYSLGNFLFDTIVSVNEKFTIQQTENNLHTYVLGVSIENGKFISQTVYPVHDTEEGIIYEDNNEYINKISKKIADSATVSYIEERQSEFFKERNQRVGKHNLKWLISRLNYYSVLSKILSRQKNFKYKRIVKKFRNWNTFD